MGNERQQEIFWTSLVRAIASAKKSGHYPIWGALGKLNHLLLQGWLDFRSGYFRGICLLCWIRHNAPASIDVLRSKKVSETVYDQTLVYLITMIATTYLWKIPPKNPFTRPKNPFFSLLSLSLAPGLSSW